MLPDSGATGAIALSNLRLVSAAPMSFGVGRVGRARQLAKPVDAIRLLERLDPRNVVTDHVTDKAARLQRVRLALPEEVCHNRGERAIVQLKLARVRRLRIKLGLRHTCKNEERRLAELLSGFADQPSDTR